MPKPLLVAVDTNVLLNLAKRDETAIDCIDTVKFRLPNAQIIVLPTVILELTHFASLPDDNPVCGPSQTEEEINDSFIVSEAAYMNAAILISSDSHIKNINQQMLRIEVTASDVGCPIIVSPWKIVHQFFSEQ